MKSIILIPKGMEEICAEEVERILGKKCSIQDNYVEIDASKEELIKFAYVSQSAFRIFYNIKRFNLNDDVNISTDKKFCVRVVKRIDNESLKQELEASIGSKIKGDVNLSHPELLFGAIVIGEKVIIGEDMFEDLSIREYKIFSHPKSIKGPIAYAIMKFSGWEIGKKFVNVEARSGEIAMEAAYYGKKFPVNFYKKEKVPFCDVDLKDIDSKVDEKDVDVFMCDKDMRNVTAAKKNSKIGGVKKWLQFTRTEIIDLDVKFKKQEVDNLVLSPMGAFFENFREVFYQADYILSKTGTVTICYVIENNQKIPSNEIKSAEEYKFKKVDEKIIDYSKVKFILRNYKKI